MPGLSWLRGKRRDSGVTLGTGTSCQGTRYLLLHSEPWKDIVFNGIRFGDLRVWLEIYATFLPRGSMEFPSEIEVFR